MKLKIGISAWGSCSALGHTPAAVWQAYTDTQQTAIRQLSRPPVWGAALASEGEQAIEELRNSQNTYARLDRSVLLAMLAAEQAVANAGWTDEANAGLLLGSSRGATGLWEKYYDQFSQNERLSPQVSPLTTAGNLASHTAQHLGWEGFATDSSITCSTALHAILNAVSWLESGRSKRFLAGGTEAPLTPFTIAQMQALKIYSKEQKTPYPCRSLQLDKKRNTMVLGEGSALFALEVDAPAPLAIIRGIGYAREASPTLTAVSEAGIGLQKAMRMALADMSGTEKAVDVIVCHSPGTIRGDQSEWRAIHSVFGKNIPSLTSNKWKLGHTLGASGGLSLELALLMLTHQQIIPIPYLDTNEQQEMKRRPIRNVMVNAQGFGGNAVSIIVGAPQQQ
jgi:3-oxoacyl-(acyl-carrier-protein) synthase